MYCQTSNVLAIDAHQSRHLLHPPSPQTTLRIVNLVPGKDYTLLLPDDEHLNGCPPAAMIMELGVQKAPFHLSARSVKFTPAASTIDVQLRYPCEWDTAHPPEHFVSVICETCTRKTWQDLQQEMSVLTVTHNVPVQELVRDVLIGGDCFDLANVTYSGRSGQIGTFANGLSNIGFSTGIIMSTGDINLAASANTVDNADLGYGDPTPDLNLNTLTSGATYDMANIEFDFTPTQTPLSFEFVFASEEYCEYVNSPFNDVFGFFISGPGITGNGNIALVPATTQPVAINNVNHLTNSGYFVNNTPAGATLCGQNPAVSTVVNEVQFDGFTVPMVATVNVVPCQTYHIKLKIADVSDGIFDSAVFLKANSFDAGGNASVNFIVNNNPAEEVVYEGCGSVQLLFDRVAANPNAPLTVQYTVSGTATPGVDYVPIPTSIIIPAGQDKFTLPVTILSDALLEGEETLIITLANLCSCQKPNEVLYIRDLPALQLQTDTVTICGPGTGTVSVTTSGGVAPFTYLWSTGANTANLSILAPSSNNYNVTVTDACGKFKVATARIVVHALPAAQLLLPAPQLCAGQQAQIMINFTGVGPFSLQYTLDNIAQPAITGIAGNAYTLVINQAGLYQITSVTDGLGCVGPGQGALLVRPSTLQLAGLVSPVKCAGQANGAINTVVSGGQGPYQYAWQGPQNVPGVDDPVGLMAGQYMATVTDGYGCKSSRTFNVTEPLPLIPAVVSTIVPNCYNVNGGSIAVDVIGGTPDYTYQWTNGSTLQNPQNLAAGTYTVTVTDAAACTKTMVASVVGNFTPPVASADAPVGLSCRNIPLPLDGTASSTGPDYTYQWTTVPPGNITDGATTMIPTVNQGGTYKLVVTNTANGCTAADSVFITSTVVYPTVSAGPDQVLTCSITNLSLNGSGSAQGPDFFYSWTASQGGTILSGATDLAPVIGTPGLYTLVVTDDFNGCTATDTVVVSENLSPPTSVIGSPPLLTCVNNSVTLTGSNSLPTGGITYQWTTTNGDIQSGQTSANAVVSEPGQYTLVVTSTANGCSHTSTVTVNQDNSVPTANAVVNGDLDCATQQLTINGAGSSTGSNFSLQWASSTGSGFVSGQNTLMPVVNAPATYTLLITNLTNQCTASATVVIGQNVQPPAANAGPPATLTCAVDTLTIGDANALTGPDLSYHWTTSGGGNIITGVNTPTPAINQPGTYNLIVTNADNGCTNTAAVVISQNIILPTAVVAPGGQLSCTMPTAQLNGTGSSTGPAFSYQWTSSLGGNIGAGSNTLMPIITAAGTYTLVVTSAANGCSASASTVVTTNANVPIATAVPVGILNCTVPQIDLSAAGSSTGANFTYSWGTVNGLILSGQGTPVISVGLPATYTLIVTNTANNCSATFAVTAPADLVPPVAEAGAGQTLLCTLPSLQLDGTGSSVGPNFSYLWTDPGIISGQATLSPTVNTAGTYDLVVTNNENGCTATDAVQIDTDVNAPIVQIATPGILNCTTTAINLSGTGSSVGNNFSYQWTGPGIMTGSTSLMAQVNAPGNYVLAITNSTNGCILRDTVTVTQQIIHPPADAGPDNQLNCSYPQVEIGGPANPTGSGYTFLWSGPGILSGGTTSHPVIDQGGLYSLTVTNTANGCTTVDQTNITTNFLYPQADAGPGFELTCTQNTYLLSATASTGPAFIYNWTTTMGSFISPTNILNPTVNGAGLYNMTVVDTTNGCTTTANVQITKAADVPNAAAATPGILTCTVASLTLSGSGSSTGQPFVYLWSSANGGNVLSGNTTLNPIVDQPGTYTLTVMDTSNQCASNSSVTVNQDITPPSVNINQASMLTCTLTSTSLQANVSSNGVFTYLWSAQNGGNIVSGATTLTPVVNAAGTYLLTITSQQNGCTNTASVPVLVNQTPPVLAIQPPDTLTCARQTVLLQATVSNPNVEYTWTTSNGHFVGQPTGLQASADQPGIYSLLIKDISNGCTTSTAIQVQQNILKPVANAGSDGLLTCAITSLELNGSGSSQNGNYFYEWTSTDGQILTGTYSLTPTIVSGGTYILVVVNGQNGCSATNETVVATDTLPPSVAIVSPGLITCTQLTVTISGSTSQSGSAINYAWITTDGHIVSGQDTRQIVVDASGLYTLKVLNTVNGCSSTADIQVTDNIVLPIADAGPPLTLTCSTDQLELQGSGSTGANYNYVWSAQSGGVIVSGANTPQPVISQPGLYQLTVTNSNTGCKQTDQVEVFRETNLPTYFQTALQRPTCKNNDGILTFGNITGGVGPYLYSIDGGQQYFPSADFANLSPGTYDLWIQDANGCEIHEPLLVPAAPVVSVSLVPEISLELGQSSQLNAMIPLNYPLALIDTVIWQPLEGLTFNGNDLYSLLHPQARPLTTTQYSVTVISVDQCEASDRILIRVDREPHIYIPNVFSPWDSDKENDVVLIFADDDQIVQVNDFQIFDRWGEMVFYDRNFQPNDPAHGWNGYHQGKLMVPAVFAYYAKILLIDGRVLMYKGDVTLLR